MVEKLLEDPSLVEIPQMLDDSTLYVLSKVFYYIMVVQDVYYQSGFGADGNPVHVPRAIFYAEKGSDYCAVTSSL